MSNATTGPASAPGLTQADRACISRAAAELLALIACIHFLDCDRLRADFSGLIADRCALARQKAATLIAAGCEVQA